MMASKHTPGPWEFGENPRGGYSNGIVVRPAGEFPHGEWIADCGCIVDEERVSNARLIAAAPDLLAVCREFISVLGPEGYHPTAGKTATDRMRAAIAKAEGRS